MGIRVQAVRKMHRPNKRIHFTPSIAKKPVRNKRFRRGMLPFL